MKPMLAATVKDLNELVFPLLASPKLDGIRAIVRHGCLLSRSLKPIPNLAVQEKFKHLEGLDGELISGPPNAKDVYRRTVSQVMSVHETAQDVQFHAFDVVNAPNVGYTSRHRKIPSTLALPQVVCRAVNEVLAYEQATLAEGYEGIMLRHPEGMYKSGRSTMNEQWLMKLKRFADDEAVVVDTEELMHNGNPAFIGELGQTKHTTHQANLVPMNTLGAIVCTWRGKHFKIGTGFSQQLRDQLWAARETLPGRTLKFKYLEVGMKDLPRHPVFLGWRAKEDM